MKHLYRNIKKALLNKEKLLAVLIDPDKFSIENTASFIDKVNNSVATHIFIGGSSVGEGVTYDLVTEIKKHTEFPIVLFPGDVTQITSEADGLLFLSLLSGRNPDYLIGKHVRAVSRLRTSSLEVISTGYILIENGKKTAVEHVTGTKPLSRNDIQGIRDTAKAGEFLGMKLVYLEAGSGAHIPINAEIISLVKHDISVPLIVGGGIRTKTQIENAYEAGADIVVVGTAFEEDVSFFDELKK